MLDEESNRGEKAFGMKNNKKTSSSFLKYKIAHYNESRARLPAHRKSILFQQPPNVIRKINAFVYMTHLYVYLSTT